MPVAAAGRAWGRGQMRRESGGVAREHAAAREAGKGDGGRGGVEREEAWAAGGRGGGDGGGEGGGAGGGGVWTHSNLGGGSVYIVYGVEPRCRCREF